MIRKTFVQKHKQKIFWFMAIFLIFFCGFWIAEIGLKIKAIPPESPLRFYHSPYTVEEWGEYVFRKPFNIDSFRHKTREFIHIRSTNDIGFTDRRSTCELRDYSNAFRILAIGDSFTEGFGTENDGTWPWILEELLNKSGKGKFIVYNAGASGCDPYFAFQNMRYLYNKGFNPHVTILLMNSGDTDDVYIKGGWDRFKDDGQVKCRLTAPWWEGIYDRYMVTRVFFRDILKYNHLLTKDSYEHIYQVASDLCFEAIDSSYKYCRNRGNEFVVVYHPLDPNRTTHRNDIYRFNEPLIKPIIGVLDSTNFLNLTDTMVADVKGEFFWAYDRHCTPKGYRMIAESIYEFIQPMIDEHYRDQNLIDSPVEVANQKDVLAKSNSQQ